MGNAAAPSQNQPPSFAQLCYQHTFAGCGCGMCHEGDVCPMPVLKLEDVHKDTDAVSERKENFISIDPSASR